MLKIALIGLGSMGRNHYRILKSLPEVQVAALCEPSPKDKYPENIYKTADELLKNETPDAAVIAVPTFLHKETAVKCMEKGVHVFIEKPVAVNAADGRFILEQAKKNGVRTAIGHVERFNPVVRSLKQELKNKEIYNISITRVGPFPPRIADVGILTDLSVHDIDLIRFITDREITETNIFKSQKIHNHYEDNAVLSFRLDKDIVASITTNWLTPFKRRKIEVATKEAYYEADLMSQELLEYSAYTMNNSYAVRNCPVKKGEPLYNEMAAFAELVRTGSESDMATIEDSIQTLEILEKSL